MKHLEKLFFLTSRNSGSIAAMKTIDLIDQEYSNLVSIEIIAKEKLCPVEECPVIQSYVPTQRAILIDQRKL